MVLIVLVSSWDVHRERIPLIRALSSASSSPSSSQDSLNYIQMAGDEGGPGTDTSRERVRLKSSEVPTI